MAFLPHHHSRHTIRKLKELFYKTTTTKLGRLRWILLVVILFLPLCFWSWGSFKYMDSGKFSYINQELTSESADILGIIETKASGIVRSDTRAALDVWIQNGNLTEDDQLLIEFVQKVALIPPNRNNISYNLKNNNVQNPSEGQIQAVWDILKNVKNGFYVECGANDGENLSNTLWLEKEKKWDGLLIEADPDTFAVLRSKNRKAWQANLCLSPTKSPKYVSFFKDSYDNGKNGMKDRSNMSVKNELKVLCIPFYTIMLALDRTEIDFFSLDIEGFELEVLKTIPFDKIFIKTLAVEHWSIPEGEVGLENFMKGKGYHVVKKISTGLSQDTIFAHYSLFDEDSGNSTKTA